MMKTGWRLETGGKRIKQAGGWRLETESWRLEVGEKT
jgi:hypothetical protein